MVLLTACRNILEQLSSVLDQIRDEDFTKQVNSLNQATVGQHIRHTLEFFSCLMYTYEGDTINYDLRDHDKVIESDRSIARVLVDELNLFFKADKKNKPLLLRGYFSHLDSDMYSIDTNFHRELAYNIEHAIHHMAIIKIGLSEVAPYIQVPDHFGVAASTMRYNAKVHSKLD